MMFAGESEMFCSVADRRTPSYPAQWLFKRSGCLKGWQLNNCAAIFFVIWLMMTPFGGEAIAVEANISGDLFQHYAERDYVQMIDTSRKLADDQSNLK